MAADTPTPAGTGRRPLRSLTLNFDEGDDAGIMRAAYTLGSDAVAFELEDHVPAAMRGRARRNIRTVLDELGSSRATFVRVNRADSPELLDDLDAVVSAGLTGILLPKVRTPEELISVDRLLTLFEQRAGLAQGHTVILPLLESAIGNRLAFEIASVSERVTYMGGMISRNGDPALSIGFEWTPEMTETLYIRQKVLLDARAAGVAWPMSGIWNPVTDLDGLERFAVESRRIGYFGMICLPMRSHVEVLHRVFTPTQDEIDYWAEVVPLVTEAETDIFVDGEPLPPNKAKWGRWRLELAAHFGVVPSGSRPQVVVDQVGGLAARLGALTTGEDHQ